jgi:hypothetical protein
MMNKILPLVLVLSLSLIIGNQVAYGAVDKWLFYGEVQGGSIDAVRTQGGASNAAGPPPVVNLSNVNADPGIKLLANVVDYQNAANSPGALSGPLIKIRCFSNVPTPIVNGLGGAFAWNFGAAPNITPSYNCIQNQRNSNDLGMGTDPPIIPANANEVELKEMVVADLTALFGAGYSNFMYRLSSNTGSDSAWVGLSNSPPSGSLDQTDFLSVVQLETTDVYVNFPVNANYLYVTQVGTGDLLLQQIKADKPEIVGGHGGPIDKTALLVTGAQVNASWMIPLLISAVGIGVFVFTRK